MAIKVVMLIQLTTDTPVSSGNAPAAAPSIGYAPRVHLAGWSESLWWDSNDVTSLIRALKTGYGRLPPLGPSRAALLGNSAQVIGARLYAGGAGKGQSIAFSFPGNASSNVNQPQSAILVVAAPTASAVSRRFTLRGVPGSQESAGEFNPSVAYAKAVSDYFQALGNFSFLANDYTVTQFKILNVSLTGVVTINGAFPTFAINDIVTVKNTLDSGQVRRNYTGQVTALDPTHNMLTLSNPTWPWGATTGGMIWKPSKVLYLINPANCSVTRIVTRKVGRPFEQYRGRRSKRRKIA
jgi:hypothetical protein